MDKVQQQVGVLVVVLVPLNPVARACLPLPGRAHSGGAWPAPAPNQISKAAQSLVPAPQQDYPNLHGKGMALIPGETGVHWRGHEKGEAPK